MQTTAAAPARLILPGLLRDLVGVAEIEVDVSDGDATVADLLDRAFVEHRILDAKVRDERGQIRRHVKIFVNGDDATRGLGLGTGVPAGARVHIINAVSGG
jgi:molybdopterin synthase sulfur carrier subunit